MRDLFVFSNWKLVSTAIWKQPRPFSQDHVLVTGAASGFQIEPLFGWMSDPHTQLQLLSMPKSWGQRCYFYGLSNGPGTPGQGVEEVRREAEWSRKEKQWTCTGPDSWDRVISSVVRLTGYSVLVQWRCWVEGWAAGSYLSSCTIRNTSRELVLCPL